MILGHRSKGDPFEKLQLVDLLQSIVRNQSDRCLFSGRERDGVMKREMSVMKKADDKHWFQERHITE